MVNEMVVELHTYSDEDLLSLAGSIDDGRSLPGIAWRGGHAVLTDRAAFILHLRVQDMKASIAEMIAAGELPSDVASFSALHDYCDANMLLPILPSDYSDDDDGQSFCAAANEIIERVDAWLANGRKEG